MTVLHLGDRSRRLAVAAISLAVVAGTGAPGHASSPGGDAGRSPGRAAAQTRTVTLVTGDRVILAGGDAKRASVIPGAGRDKIRFVTQHSAGKLLVIPSDVATLVGTGRLDRRLFDVSGLIEAGYDDSRSRSIPLIVTYAGPAGRVSMRSSGAETVRELPSVNGSAVRITKGRRFSFMSGERMAAGFERVWLDGKRRVSLDVSVPQIGAPAAWQSGLTGKGVTVAVLDTGIDATHPELADRVLEARNFTGSPPGDRIGHGTHVASTIAGTGDKYRGVAPDAKLLDGKVCGDVFCEESAILAGMQWAASEKRADVVNLSLGSSDTPGIDPVEEAVNTLTAQTGSLFVVAAGNDGGAETVGSPASADAALAVGAVDKSDELAWFSSRGPRVGDGAIKPDITAPGVDIVAAKSKDGVIGDPVDAGHVRMSGTSMATPHTAGAAALLAQQHPDWAATELKAALMSSAKAHQSQTAFEQGAGRVDVARAITQTVVSQPGSASFGTARWPHNDDEPVAKQITYRNLGSADVTLNLRGSMSGPDGQPAPATAMSLGSSSVTVPAGGTATVTVTSNTNHDGPDGAYSGRIVATAEGVSVTTPVAVTREVESYDMTLKYIAPDGKPAIDAFSFVFSKPSTLIVAPGADGTVTARMPKDTYAIDSAIIVDKGNGETDDHSLNQPFLQLTRDTVVTVDARTTKPVGTTVARAGVEPALVALGMHIDFDGVALSFSLLGQQFDGIFTAPMGDPAPDKVLATLESQWGVPGADRLFVNSPYVYELVNTQRGQYWHGFTRTVRDRDLATVAERYGAQVDDRRAFRFTYGAEPDMSTTWAAAFRYDLPTRSIHLRDDGPVRWTGALREYVVENGWEIEVTELQSLAKTYRAGQSYSERWNAAVFGPAFPTPSASRFGDLVVVGVPMYSDQDGHGGFSRTDTASTKLYRDGELIGESPFDASVFVENVAGEPADFKLVSTATRPKVSGLSTRTDAVWTFRSQTASEEGERLPLWAVRYFPSVDDRNAVKRSPVTVLPVKLETPPGADAGTLTKVEVEVSGDDGTTWTKAAVRRTGDNRYVAVFATPKGSHVSLKAKAADSNGNTTEQGIVRAYTVK